MQTSHQTNHSYQRYAPLIAAYVNGTINPSEINRVERLIGEREDLNDYYKRKLQEKEFIMQLIPDHTPSKNSLANIKREIREINNSIFPKEKVGLLKKAVKFLNKPLIEFEF